MWPDSWVKIFPEDSRPTAKKGSGNMKNPIGVFIIGRAFYHDGTFPLMSGGLRISEYYPALKFRRTNIMTFESKLLLVFNKRPELAGAASHGQAFFSNCGDSASLPKQFPIMSWFMSIIQRHPMG